MGTVWHEIKQLERTQSVTAKLRGDRELSELPPNLNRGEQMRWYMHQIITVIHRSMMFPYRNDYHEKLKQHPDQHKNPLTQQQENDTSRIKYTETSGSNLITQTTSIQEAAQRVCGLFEPMLAREYLPDGEVAVEMADGDHVVTDGNFAMVKSIYDAFRKEAEAILQAQRPARQLQTQQ